MYATVQKLCHIFMPIPVKSTSDLHVGDLL